MIAKVFSAKRSSARAVDNGYIEKFAFSCLLVSHQNLYFPVGRKRDHSGLRGCACIVGMLTHALFVEAGESVGGS